MPDNRFSFLCGGEDAGSRLDKFLSARLKNASRSQFQKWIKAGCASVNGLATSKNTVLKPGDTVEVAVPPGPKNEGVEPEDLPLNIVYEDDHLVVVDKPKGMPAWMTDKIWMLMVKKVAVEKLEVV